MQHCQLSWFNLGLFAFLSNLFWCINAVEKVRWSVNYSSRNRATYTRYYTRLYVTISSKVAFLLYVHSGCFVWMLLLFTPRYFTAYTILKQQNLMNCNESGHNSGALVLKNFFSNQQLNLFINIILHTVTVV